MTHLTDADLLPHLPLHLIQSEIIPPAPNTAASTGSAVVDWLPDFAGYSWIAYGASSLLVLSHFPSPLSPHQSRLGPIFRQIFDLSLSSDSPADVAAVSWSPDSPSSGDLAAAVDHCVFLFQYISPPGSFCWSQTGLLVQSSKAEAVKWTGSGDGLISVGEEVVLWKRNSKAWEIAWKFRTKVSQTMVSTTWSLEGPSATGAYPAELRANELASMPSGASNPVSIFHFDGKSGDVVAELEHPRPVFATQWRPSGGSQSNRTTLYAPKHVLLTSCLDGTVRLWSEVDGSRIRKGNKDNHDQLTVRRSFCVVAVIEINQTLNGSLGADIFVNWVLDLEGVVSVSDGPSHFFSFERSQNDEAGRCEWLVGFGPGKMVTFWAVHCLDDTATMRSPRVTLWKRQELQESALGQSFRSDYLKFTEGSQLQKVVIWRNQHFSPPAICSLVQVSDCNSLVWSLLYDQSLLKLEGEPSYSIEAGNKLACQSGGILDTFGHTGRILGVSVHPFVCEVQVVASLDSNGLLVFWSISSSSCSISGQPSFSPSWQIRGRVKLHDTISQGMSLFWAPLCLDEDRILLTGHIQGVDVHLIKICETKGQEILCHKLCSIPFVGHDHLNGPDKIVSFPLDPTFQGTLKIDHFLVVGVWMKNFQAESWKVTLHSYDSSSCCQCNLDSRKDSDSCTWAYKSDFSGKTYCMVVNLCSSYFPDVHDKVTSFSAVSPSSLMPSIQQMVDVESNPCANTYPYHIATGHLDGSSRLWRIKLPKISDGHTPFELVGMFDSLAGPVAAISVADWGQKIATICPTGQENGGNMLCIWEPLHLGDTGALELEDKIFLHEEVRNLHWLVIENMLFLGVSFQGKLHIYSRRIYCAQTSALGASTWVRIAIVRDSTTIRDFLLGPFGMIILIHEKYLTLFCEWSFLLGNKHLSDDPVTLDSGLSSISEMGIDSRACYTARAQIFKDLSLVNSTERSGFWLPLTKRSCCLVENGTQSVVELQRTDCFLKMTEVAEQLCGPLPLYHPEALLMNIYSGNWRRAYVAVSHLFDSMASNTTFEQRSIRDTSITQINLVNYLEGQLSDAKATQSFQWSNDINTATWSSYSDRGPMEFAAHDATHSLLSASLTSSETSRLETLEKLFVIESLSDSQKMQMFAIVDLLREIYSSQSASAYDSFDETGRRFWCALRLLHLEFRRRYHREPLMNELVVDSQLIAWAFHSECHTSLFDIILPTEPTWQDMRKIGVGFWLTNLMDLRTKMEKLARREYLKNKDPKACALLYIALNRIQVLAGLFKISKDEKDKPLVAFLSRNFQEEKHKAAALKNAYVLMGRHQFELAIAFFLLGGDVTSAVNVCAKTLGDGQLALVICRLVEGQAGPSESHLISKILLPSAIEKGDYWLASVLQWILGNYLQSFLVVLGLDGDSHVSETEKWKRAGFVDPNIGQYCQVLAAKNSLRSAVGEQNAAILCRWAILMAASAFNKCGLPLEALECLSSSASILGSLHKGTENEKVELLPKILRPSPADSSRWLSNEVGYCLEYQIKLDLAMQYVAKLMAERPGSYTTSLILAEAGTCSLEHDMNHVGGLLKCFEQKLDSALAYFEQKFSLVSNILLKKVFVSSYDSRLFLIVYDHLLCASTSEVQLPTSSHANGSSSKLLKHLIKGFENLSSSLSRFVTAGSIASLQTLASTERNESDMKSCHCFQYLKFYMRGFITSLCSLRAVLMMYYNDCGKDLIEQFISTLEIYKYYIYITSTVLQSNESALAAVLQPLLVLCTNRGYREIDMVSLKGIVCQGVEAFNSKSSGAIMCGDKVGSLQGDGDQNFFVIPEDERRIILGASLWKHLFKFIKCQQNQLHISSSCDLVDATLVPSIIMAFIEAMERTATHVSTHSAMQLAVFFWHKKESGASAATFNWLQGFNQSKPGSVLEHVDGRSLSSEVLNDEASLSNSELLAKICDRETISEMLAQSPIKLSDLIHWNSVRWWNHLHMGVLGEHEWLESYKQEGIFDANFHGSGGRSPRSGFEQSHNLLDPERRGTALVKEVLPFKSPREIYRRNGELLEALCINSIEQRQAAVTSNKKGIIFFDWGDGLPLRDFSDYVWAEADWPRKGWAGTVSTPVPTCVTPGVGLGSNKGSHLGLGGATVGNNFQSRLRKELAGGAFGIPDYAGIDATGMGWGIQDDFDNFIDPPATLDNINAGALASHPSKPYFLVGSSNTHIYLWEFGEEKAVATYGVLPAANVPPPYALASITALQFDCCGHRFANGASDGTVCTWQLEVGGRSNVRPTESSLCFSGGTSDIRYVATSGSIIAATGYSSNGMNVVIWDTLAPPTSSRASVMCHEGGACSISVFDNDVGTGSVSPLIVTGGKGGDVGLHDFRYIATGKTKRNRHSDTLERAADTAAIDVRSQLSSSVGDQNRHGMLWYIPKAHSGSVTKLATIPNTSFFLTGSKDGDVKLWDAKRACLVFQWPKLHERHTFLQRSSQGFGGVTRAGITDIRVISDGFLTCGGDGSVKLVELNNFPL